MKKLDAIQKQLDMAIAQVASAESILPRALVMSASRLGLECKESELKALAVALRNSENSRIKLDLEIPSSLGQTEEEVQATINSLVGDLNETIKHISEQVDEVMPEVVQTTLEKMADLIEDELLGQSTEHTEYLRTQERLRAETVERLWGKAVDQLNLLRNLVIEWSRAATELEKGPYASTTTALALSKITLRAYDMAGEIIALARAGYADGALARWRSLHEICVIAIFLSKQSDKCAQMYLAHSVIEELRLIESNEASGTISVNNSRGDGHWHELKKHKDHLTKIYGSAFAKDYGWASVELNRAKITFRELESNVGMESFRQSYQHANSATHGGALAALTRISLGVNAEYSGEMSPAFGCEVAISYASGSLATLIAELCLDTESADLLVMNMVVQKISSNVFDRIKNGKSRFYRTSLRSKVKLRQEDKTSKLRFRKNKNL